MMILQNTTKNCPTVFEDVLDTAINNTENFLQSQ